MPGLLIGHSNGAIKGGPGVPITWVKEIKNLTSKIQPVILIEIRRMILTNHGLKLTLPIGNGIVIRLCSRSKIIRRVVSLLMKIDMHHWHPFQIDLNTLLGFGLCLPRPISVQIEHIVIGSPPWPWFVMLHSLMIRVELCPCRCFIPIHIPISPIGINHGVYYHHHIVKPLRILRHQGMHGIKGGFT